MNGTMRSTGTFHAVDNYDWLKTVAIILVAVDHFGYFFMENADWWSVFGRMAAPIFFFLMGYAHSRMIPLRWIWLGAILTLLDSWNNVWMWMTPNILFSLILIRVARPHVKMLLQRYRWVAFTLLVCVLIAVLPIAGNIVDYGAEGWLWALFGLCQRMYVDGKKATSMDCEAQNPTKSTLSTIPYVGIMQLLACIVAAVVYIWQEQSVFWFSPVQLATVTVGIAILSVGLSLFRPGPSSIQPTEPIARLLHFIGRHTLEIYAIQLAGSEIIINFFPYIAI